MRDAHFAEQKHAHPNSASMSARRIEPCSLFGTIFKFGLDPALPLARRFLRERGSGAR